MTTFDQIYSEIAGQVRERTALNFFEAHKQDPDRRVVLYGAGGNCQFALHACSHIHVDCICDSVRGGETYIYQNACGASGETTAYRIISPADLLEKYRDAFVCITSWKYEEEIRSSLIESGFPVAQILYLRSPFVIAPEVFERNYLDGYRWAYEFFQDDRSRQKVVDRMRMFLLGEACPPDSLFKDGYLVFPGISLGDDEVYIDGGAYVGDTAEEFISNMKAAGKRYSHIYSFEPDPHSLERAEKNLAPYERVDIVPYGLWSKPDCLCFNSDSTGSAVVPPADNGGSADDGSSGGDTILVTSLDVFFKEKSVEEWPTLIKMDLEGSEREALMGAAEIIKAKKPQLIICAYHKPEDIYELPQTILKFRSDYKLSLWQIGESFWDVILYAI